MRIMSTQVQSSNALNFGRNLSLGCFLLWVTSRSTCRGSLLVKSIQSGFEGWVLERSHFQASYAGVKMLPGERPLLLIQVQILGMKGFTAQVC